MIKRLAVLAMVLQSLDILSTMFGLKHGLHEANPIAIMIGFPQVYIIKLLVMSLVVSLAYQARMRRLLIIVCLLSAAAVVSNVINIWRTLGG